MRLNIVIIQEQLNPNTSWTEADASQLKHSLDWYFQTDHCFLCFEDKILVFNNLGLRNA